MMESLVMTVIGDDRPGLVELLARTVADCDGNWLESRMSHLAGKFAGILRVDIPADRVAPLLETLRGLESGGLRVASEASAAAAEDVPAVRLELMGADHVGIVRDIAALLARRQINVEEFTTDCVPAPMSGQMLFQATALLRLPPGVTEAELRADLEDVAQDLMVDITLSDEA
ncbi:MAG: ACT domain-containing protein [Gemmatimonadota bacterium]